MRIVDTSSNGGSQESVIYSNSNKGKSRSLKPHFEVDTEIHIVDIINLKVRLMEVDEETLK